MADIEQVLQAKMVGETSITDLVGTRVYPLKAPDNPTFPFITYQRIDSEPIYTMDGGGNRVESRFQIDAWDRGLAAYKNTKAIARALQAVLSNWREVVSGVDVQSFMRENENDDWESEAGVARVSQDWRVFHSE